MMKNHLLNLSFNKRLKFLRLNKNLTQQEIADYLKIDKSTYAHYEKGDRYPNAAKLIKLAKLYDLIDEILGVYHE